MRITGYFLLSLLGLLFALWLLLQTPGFQNWLVHTAAQRLSRSLGARVQVKSAYIGFLNRLNIEGVIVEDQQRDTMISVGRLQVNATDWLLFKDTVVIKYVALKDVKVRLYRNDTTWNYAFLNKLFGSQPDTASSAKAAVDTGNTAPALVLRLEILQIDNLRFIQADRWRGKSMLAGVDYLYLQAREFDLDRQQFHIEKLVLQKPEYRELRKKGNWSAADSIAYYRKIDSLDRLRTFPESWNPGGMSLAVDQVKLEDGIVEIYNRLDRPFVRGEFDEKDIIIQPVSGTFKNLALDHDTLTSEVNIAARERSGLNIKKLKTRLRMHPQLMEFNQLDLQLNESRLGPYYAMRYRTFDDMEYFVDSVRISARMENSSISMKDIAFFAPQLKSIEQVATLSGSAEGTVSNFTVRNVDLRTGNSRLTGTYSMKGLIDIDHTIIDFNTPGSRIALPDVAVWAPQLLQLKNTPVSKLGVVTYTGNFKGTVYDFAARGTVQTDVGYLGADLKMRLTGKSQGFEGTITNAHINGAQLLDVPDLGAINFDGKIRSNGFSASNPLLVEGDVHSLEYKGYKYSNLQMEGRFQNSALEADLSVADPNLGANINIVLNFKEKKQRYNARGAVAHADLLALGLAKDTVKVSGLFDVDFIGNTSDEFMGYARVYDAEVYDKSELLSIDSLLISSSMDETGRKFISVNTNEAAVNLEGKFKLAELPNSFKAFLHGYYPSIIPPPQGKVLDQDLIFYVDTREVEPFLHFLDPKLKGLNNTHITGSLNTAESKLLVNVASPYFSYDGLQLQNIEINAQGGIDKLVVESRIENLSLNDSLGFPKVRLFVNTNADTTSLKLTTSSKGPVGDAAINAHVYSYPDGFEMQFDESSLIINNKKWTISSTSNIELHKKYLIAKGIDLSQGEQRIQLHSTPSDEGDWNDLEVNISEFIIGDVLPYVLQEPRLEGLLSGKVVIEDPLGKPLVKADLEAKQFYFNSDSVGLVKLSGDYNAVTNRIMAKVNSDNPEYDFGSTVRINLSDSVHNQIDADIELRKEKLSMLQNYLGVVFSSMDGFASGNLKVVGPFSRPAIIGRVLLNQAAFTVDYTKCTYTVDSSAIVFGDNFINFGTMRLKDVKGRSGTLSGIMYHRFFDSLSFNIKMQTNGMQVLNTGARDNDLFYGNAVARASFELTGPLNNMQMKVTGETTDTSHIIIANKTGKESGEADYIVFKQYGTEQVREVDTSETNIHMDLDLTANPLCKIDVVMDEISGDKLSATGTGNIKIRTGTIDATVMRGRYQIESGSYNYSFQTIIKKPFELEGGDKSYIEWNGDPYDALLNVSAKYTAQNVSLKDLVGNEQNQTVLDQSAQNYKGDVYVKTKVTGRLSAPRLAFDIEFPPGSPMLNNVSAQAMLSQIRGDNSEMLRQVTYLIVFRSFAPYKQGTSTRNPGADLAMNTLSDLLSNQMEKILTNVVQNITGDKSLNVDFSTEFYNSSSVTSGNVNAATGYDRVTFNFMLNKSYYNNRVVVNVGSNFDLDVRNTALTGFQFLPDVSVEFILTQNRRLRAIVFKKDNLDFAGRRNRAGVSLSYRKDFDRFISSVKDEGLIFIRKSADANN